MTIIIQDNFTGPNGEKLTARPGWVLLGSGWGPSNPEIGSNQLVAAADAGDAGLVGQDTLVTDHYVQANVYAGLQWSSGNIPMLCIRSTNRGEAWGIFYRSGAGQWQMFKSGTGGGLGAAWVGSFTAGDFVRLEAEGNIIRAYINGTLRITQDTLGNGASNTGVGILGWNVSSGTVLLDNYEAGTLGGSAPVLSTPTASATSPTTSTGSVSTDQADGTLYWLTNTSATATDTAVKAGSSQAVTTTGTQTTVSSGLTASTTYYTHFLHRNASGQDSAVVSSASFTTPAPAVPPTMNGSITVGTKTSGSISISYPAASDPVGVTGYEVSKDGTTWLDNGTSLSYTFLGLVPLTSYTLSVRAYNAAGLRASPALSVTTSTYREGATGQHIKDNTGPQDGNPEGILYDDVDLPGDANKWFSYRVTTPPVDPDAITLNPDGSFIFTGLVADSFYYQLEVDGEDVGVPQLVTLAPDDPTPPVLSDPTGVATSPTTASGTVVTNESGGTLYFVTTQNATESGTTVKAGASQAVTASGLQSVSSTSLSGATTYYNHYLHRGATGNDSLVVSSAAFTTPAVPPDPPVLSSPTATTTSATTASGTVSTTSSTGTLFILVSTNNAITDAAFWASTSKQSQPVTATGVQTVSLTALSPSTTYTAYYGQIDSFSNQSNVVKSAQFTTDAAPPSTGSKQLNISLRIGFGL